MARIMARFGTLHVVVIVLYYKECVNVLCMYYATDVHGRMAHVHFLTDHMTHLIS